MKIFKYILMPVLFLAVFGNVSAQQLLNGEQAALAAEEITSNYTDWTSAAWSGKLKSKMLPISVSVKTYLLKDSLVMLSMRAPLMGEVARIEFDRKKILLVNKMKKWYVELDLTSLKDIAAIGFNNLQDIMIGRVTLMGIGTLSAANSGYASIYSVGNQDWLVSASIPIGPEQIDYGYAVDSAGQILDMIVNHVAEVSADVAQGTVPSDEKLKDRIAASICYSDRGEADADINIIFGGRQYSASLNDVKMDWGATGFERINITRGYTRCSIKELLRF